MKEKNAVVQLQANKCQEMPGANRSDQEAGKNSPLKPSEGARAFKQLDFRLLNTETMHEYISVVLNHCIHGHLLGSLGNCYRSRVTVVIVIIIIYKEWLLLAPERGVGGRRHLPGTLVDSQKMIAQKDWELCPGGFVLCFQHIRHYFSKTLAQ